MKDSVAFDCRSRWLHAARALLLVCVLLPAVAVAAVEPVGHMVSASGDVTAVRAGESARSLDRGDPVYEGDELRTGVRASAQIRFADGGLFALDNDTRFSVDSYETNDDGGGSALMSFLRGALRTITGTIGSRSDDDYRLRTPTATIGVRGTAYALSYCDAECAAGHDGRPGLYGQVGSGGVLVNTPKGVAEFGAGSYFFVSEDGVSRAILKPPKGILDGGADEARGEAGEALDDAAAGGGLPSREEAAEWFESLGITGVIFESGDTFEGGGGPATGVSGALAAFSPSAGVGIGAFPAGGNFTTDGSGNLDGVQFPSGPIVQVTGATLDEAGIESDLGVAWGRWSGGFDVDGSPATGNLAFAVSDNFTQPTTLASLNGSLTYGNPVGPQPFDDTGAAWAVDALSLGVDFDAVDITLNQFDLSPVAAGAGLSFTDLDVNDPSVDLDLSANGLALSVVNSGGGAALIGRFVGGAADGLIVVFEANQTGGPQISGLKILRPQ